MGCTKEITCVACGRLFTGHFNAIVCSPECRKARRRGVDAGCDALPPPTRQCAQCGVTFPADRNRLTCSPECQRARKQAMWREQYRSLPDEKKRAAVERAKERRRENPEQARDADARKWAKTKVDPERLAKARQKARDHYAAHADAIQAARRERIENLSGRARETFRERARRYTRDWRRRRSGKPTIGRTCSICGASIDHLRLNALTCPGDCARQRIAERRVKVRRCANCGSPFRPTIDRRKTCSPRCQRERRRELLARRRSQRRPPLSRTCRFCGATFATRRPKAVMCRRKECHRAYQREHKRRRAALRPPLADTQCVVCSRLFTPDRRTAKVCGLPPCRAEHKRQGMRDVARGRPHRGSTERRCEVCERDFSGHPNSRVCSRRCRLDRQRELSRVRLGIEPRRCIVCEGLVPIGRNHYTCSQGCQDKARRRRARRSYEKHPERRERQVERHRHRIATDAAYRSRSRHRDRERHERKAAEAFTARLFELKDHLTSRMEPQDAKRPRQSLYPDSC